jgi:hypothetical protein
MALLKQTLPRRHQSLEDVTHGWVDDITYIIVGPEKNRKHSISRIIYNYKTWSHTHRSTFDMDKTTLTHFFPPRTRQNTIALRG